MKTTSDFTTVVNPTAPAPATGSADGTDRGDRDNGTPFATIGTVVAIAGAALLAACSSPLSQQPASPAEAAAAAGSRIERVETTPDATSTSRTVDGYKRDIALRISEVNSTKVYPGQPQALLRSIIVIKFSVDASGKLLRSEIVRTNHDAAAESTALASLRSTAPFPKPASHLLRNGKLEVSETWLFNNDGRFQIRSVAQAQMDR